MRLMVIRAIIWIKQKFLILFLVAVIYFWGLWASLGLTLGYFLTKYFSGPIEREKGRFPSLRLSIGRYKLHLHHWMVAISFIVTLCIGGILSPNNFLFWMGGGMALQGILCYNDWYKIVYRR